MGVVLTTDTNWKLSAIKAELNQVKQVLATAIPNIGVILFTGKVKVKCVEHTLTLSYIIVSIR